VVPSGTADRLPQCVMTETNFSPEYLIIVHYDFNNWKIMGGNLFAGKTVLRQIALKKLTISH